MRNFSLSKPNDKALPVSLTVAGSQFGIRPGHKNILRILRLYEDPNVREEDKEPRMCKFFFVDRVPPDPSKVFVDFLLCGAEPAGDSNRKDYDYEFDAPEIFASFLMLYGIDLFKVSLHWWTFRALFGGCLRAECPLSEKIRVRLCNPEKCADPEEAARAKADAQLPDRVSLTELILQKELVSRLKKGQGIADLLKG